MLQKRYILGLFTPARHWLGRAFEPNARPLERLDGVTFPSPQDVIYPGDDADLVDHVRFLLQAKHYIKNHPVPEERVGKLNQYSHAGKPLIGDDKSTPAITNCSYEHFKTKIISIGFPLFIDHAPMVIDNEYNPRFNPGTLWESFKNILTRYTGDLGPGSTKSAYNLPMNHWYIEKPVSNDVFQKAQHVIEFFTRTNIEDPTLFIKTLDDILKPSPKPTAPSFEKNM